MAIRRGISILDLLPQTTGGAGFVPDDVVERLGVLTVLEHRSTASPDYFLHEGTLQSPADALDLDTSDWAVRVPGLTHGLPFRLALRRAPAPAGGQEGAPALWTLDVQVWDVEVLLPGVRAARQVGGAATVPLHLEPASGGDAARQVTLVARGVLRVAGGAGAPAQVQLVDAPDPLDPAAPSGAVVRLTARPQHFVFGDSQFGMTLDQVALDLSPTFTPPEVAARGHDESWRGVAFREATFYLPPDTPVVHSLSLGARDVIVGDPGGMQGELRVEFGQDFADQYNAHIVVEQQNPGAADTPVAETTPPPRGTQLEFAVAPDDLGRPRRVRVRFVDEAIPGQAQLGVMGRWWRLPTGEEGNAAVTPYFDAPADRPFRYRLRVGERGATYPEPSPPTAIPDGLTELAEVAVRFPRQGGPAGANPPLVDAVIDGTPCRNVVHLRGPRERLQGVVLQARDGAPGDWLVGGGSAPAGAAATPSFTLPLLAEGAGAVDVRLRTAAGVRRVRVEVVRTGPLAIGHQHSEAPGSPAAVSVAGADATPTRVLDTFDARAFHARAERPAAGAAATIAGPQVTVPPGTIAEVEVLVPAGATDPLPAPPPAAVTTRAAVQLLYVFGEGEAPHRVVYPLSDADVADAAARHAAGTPGAPDPTRHEEAARAIGLPVTGRAAPAGASPRAQLRAWVQSLPAAAPGARKFFVVGRTDDLTYGVPLAQNHAFNDGLAEERARSAKAELVAAGVPEADVVTRIERAPFPAGAPALPGDAPARFGLLGRLALPAGAVATPAGQTHPVWNGRWSADGPTSEAHYRAKGDPIRDGYRCADILAVDTAAPPPEPAPPPPAGDGGVPTNILVPGPDGAAPPPLPTTTTAPPPTDYRVRLRARWDSPTVVSVGDAIPTDAEATVAWKPAAVELPGGPDGPLPAPTGADFWEVLLHWTYDARTGQTEMTGALSLPDGAVRWPGDAVAGALAFGPALSATLADGDTVGDAGARFAVAAALFAAGAGIGEAINTGGGPEGSVDVDRIALSYRWNGESRVSATLDYTVDLRVHVPLPGGAGAIDGRLKLRYKGVGLQFVSGKPGLQGVALSYDGLSVEVVDPGQWSLGGPLGSLIRVAASRIGNGSTWMEFDLDFAVDLGVVRLEGATVRVTLDPAFSVELRGLAARLKVDGVIEGRGAMSVADGGAIRALLALQVIPAKLGAYGSLAVDQDFVAVEVGVQFPVGLPLGGTGLGLFGVMGRFVANGRRDLPALGAGDPVARELEWYGRAPQAKYARHSGQYALGLGAVIGTLPDGGFTFNAEGSLAVGFPDVSVVLGIDAKLAAQRKLAATEGGAGSAGSSTRILGLTVIEPDSVMVAVRATYEIPKVLRLEVPFSAYFPLQSTQDAWFIRLGTDNHADRPGAPVTIVLFPGILDVRAWAFLMVEERGLKGLGGSLVPLDLADPLDFDGFAIGMGAGLDLRWSAGPFKLEISAFLLVGVGTKPLLVAGAMGVRGELDLVLVSVSVDGLVHAHVTPDYKYVEGHFCGHVDFFFFEVEGCVDLRIGDEPPNSIPVPPTPLLGVDLCDHLAAVKGKAAPAPADAPAVWPDTVAVLKFAHFVDDGLGDGSAFVRKVAPPAALSRWSGSTELKYAYRLKSLELHRLTGADPASDASWTKVSGPFDSAWWLPTHRRAVVLGDDATGPSTEEGRELGLFHWDPRAWSRWLGEGSQELPGDPAGTVGEVCEAPKPAERSCAWGKDPHPAAGALARFDAVPKPGAAFPSRFRVRARLDDALDPSVLAAIAGDAGWTYVPGGVAALAGPATVEGVTVGHGWRLPALRAGGAFVTSLPTRLRFSKPLQAGAVVLQACTEPQAPLPQPTTTCDRPPSATGVIVSYVGQSGTRYGGQALEASKVGAEPVVVVTSGTLRGERPAGGAGATTGVRVDVLPRGGAARLRAFGAGGELLGEATTAGLARQSLNVNAAGIARMTVEGVGGTPVVFQVCWTLAASNPLAELVGQADASLPRVTFYDAAGKSVTVTAAQLAAGGSAADAPDAGAALALGATAVAAANPCAKFTFALPAPSGAAGAGGWVRAEVHAWRRGPVTLIATCGVTLEAAQAQADDATFRGSLVDLLGELAADATANEPTRAVYLDGDATYQLRVGWQYQGFRPDAPGDEAPPPAADAWIDAPEVDRYTFRTAAFGTVAPPAPAAENGLETDPAQGGPGYDERVFDPRGVARFVTRAAPNHEDPPHFLDDPVGFWFMADHLESLLEKYDRVLQVRVLHTRHAPGALHGAPAPVPGGAHPLDVTIKVSKQIETATWFDPDLRFSEAAAAAPCVGAPPALGSSSLTVTADLAPGSEYDLLLKAVPETVGASAEIVIARNHFSTSRYRNPTELLRALGFRAPTGSQPPVDAIAAAPLAAAPLAVGDAALDAALAALGMDPWPLPAGPRTTVIWERPSGPGAPWRVAGVLLEADEPIWRAGFRTGEAGEADPPPRLDVERLKLMGRVNDTTFSIGDLGERVRNAAGTRILFAAATPFALAGAQSYALDLTFRERGSTGASGQSPLFDRPMVVFQEGA